MNILHYSLGFPPYRTGGLTKFCMDLMREQVKEGHKVGLLWPGKMRFINHSTQIKEGKHVDGISNYEVINPLPVPFDEGIKEFDVFTEGGDLETYSQFLRLIKPDVIHVHTFMGLHRNFLVAAKKLGIRLVFTTHDFFPICPKVTMFRHGQICNSIESCSECGVCNNTALSLKKITILQSHVYRVVKDSRIVKVLRKRHRDEYLGDDSERDNNGSVGDPEDYRLLRKHYQNMLSLMDKVHYNSTITKATYEKVFTIPDSNVISITHSDISDHKRIKKFSNSVIRIRFLGPQGAAKGFFLLKASLDKLWDERQDFVLDVHFAPSEPSLYMRTHEKYNYYELEQIFDETDVLIVPSIWYETFGYTVLEALSYGVPVIISDTVGAKDILSDGAGIEIENISIEKLYRVVKGLTKEKLATMNRRIVDQQHILTIREMSNRIIDECYMTEI